MKIKKQHIKLLKNKYLILFVLAVIWLTFFDQNNLISRFQAKKELQKLEKDKKYYKEQIELTKNAKEELLTNKNTLEKFAREKYLMKKDDEDIYIVVDKEKE